MNAAVVTLPERGFARDDWHIDVQVPYGTNRAWDLGFDIGPAFREFASDEIYDAEDYVAEVVHWSPYLDPPDETTLFRLGRMCCALYVEALKKRDERLRHLRSLFALRLRALESGRNAAVSPLEREADESAA